MTIVIRAGALAALVAMLLGVLLVMAASGAALAQEAPPAGLEVRVDLEPREATLGDRVRMTVTVTHADTLLITVEPPAPQQALVVVETVPAATASLGDGRLRTEFGFTFAAFELGRLQPGAVRVRWLQEDGSAGSEVASAPPFEVVSALIGDATALRPLKPQATFGDAPAAWLRPAIVAGAAAVLAVLAGALVVRRSRRAAAPPTVLEPVEVGPETAARRRLEELAASGTLEAGEFEAFYGTLSLVMRHYLEERFAFRATALTTRELESRMGAEGVERWQSRLAEGLLDRCDAAVYARAAPDPASADHDLTVAFEIVELSRGRPAAEVVAGSGARGAAGAWQRPPADGGGAADAAGATNGRRNGDR